MYQKKTNMETTLTIKKTKTYKCLDCGGQFKITVNNSAVNPKYCLHCSRSKTKK